MLINIHSHVLVAHQTLIPFLLNGLNVRKARREGACLLRGFHQTPRPVLHTGLLVTWLKRTEQVNRREVPMADWHITYTCTCSTYAALIAYFVSSTDHSHHSTLHVREDNNEKLGVAWG